MPCRFASSLVPRVVKPMSDSLPKERFSDRFGVRPRIETRQPDDIPESAKARLVTVIDRLRRKYLPGAYSLGPLLHDVMGRKSQGTGDMPQIRQLVTGLDCWEFYELCEELLRITGAPDKVAEEIDALFVRESLPYKITSSGITWRLSPPASEAVSEARHLLAQPEFAGPSQQWEKAFSHLSERPPDPENCIKDAVGALEGLARILGNKPSETLGQIIKPLAVQLGMHSALANALSNIYGYRSDEQAIAHGATSAFSDILVEAELVLHWCAAAMAYLTKKKDRAAIK